MTTQATASDAAPSVFRAAPADRPASSRHAPAVQLLAIALQLLLVAVLVAAAQAAATALGLGPGSDLGYWIGVAGAGAMLLLFAYSLRKRFRWLARLGALRYWFVVHMTLGLLGPWLILVHSRFEVGSMNAAVALYSMLVVAFSGLVGRFIYRRVHRTLDGTQTQMRALQSSLDELQADLEPWLAELPQVRDDLSQLRQRAQQRSPRLGAAVAHWLATRREAHRLVAAVSEAMDAAWRRAADGQSREEILRIKALRRAWRQRLVDYASQAGRVAMFSVWERLLALWHVLHLPFVWIMVLCAIAHVVAVHAY
jgi:hypothetical protein